MNENEILDILNSKNVPQLLNKIGKIYPGGCNMEELDIRIQKKIKELEEKFAKYNNSIEDIRKDSTYK